MVHLILVVKLSLPGEVKAGVTLRTYINASIYRERCMHSTLFSHFKKDRNMLGLQDDRNDIKMGHMGKKDR